MSHAMRCRKLIVLVLTCAIGLSGCDMLGMESASVVAARRDAEGKAVGAGCRQAARSVEQCYGLNKRAEKAAVFAGWREMNDYMRDNKLEAMPAGDDSTTEVASAADHGAAPAQAKPDASAKGAKATAKH